MLEEKIHSVKLVLHETYGNNLLMNCTDILISCLAIKSVAADGETPSPTPTWRIHKQEPAQHGYRNFTIIYKVVYGIIYSDCDSTNKVQNQ